MNKRSFLIALTLFVVLRLFLTGWAWLQLALNPLPTKPDELLRPYLGTEILGDGLLAPWQRFDSNRYMRIAMEGYAHEEDSVFPPLYPLLVRGIGTVLSIIPHDFLENGERAAKVSPTTRYMSAGILVSNLACLACFWLFYQVASQKIGATNATRALIYFALFPTGFFLFAAYTEPLFILLVMGTLWSAEKGSWASAGICAFLATLTRTTGVVLFIPLLYATLSTRPRLHITLPLLLSFSPLFAFGLFLTYRHLLGLPAISQIYAQHWHQTTSLPGYDLFTAAKIMITGQGVRAGELTLLLDFLTVFLLLGAVWITFRRFGGVYGWYLAMMLLFMLLPRSDWKPLYSFTRYALAFFPMFWWWASAGTNAWLNRLILYPSLLLYLYLSGQFFIWGWVA